MNWSGKFTFFKNLKTNQGTLVKITWDKLAKQLETPRCVPDRSNVPLFSAATFIDNKRSNANALELCALVLDYDKAPLISQSLIAWQDVAHLAYTSWSHGSEEKGNAYRVIIPLAEPIPAAQYLALWRLAYEHTGHAIDKQCKDTSRIQYVPVVQPDPPKEYRHISQEGSLLDWRALCLESIPSIKPARPIPSINPQPTADRYTAAAVDGKFSDAIARMAAAADGEKHHVLMREAELLGGLLHYGRFTEQQAIDALVSAIADRAKDLGAARKSAAKAVAHGATNPVMIPEPKPKPEQSRSAAPPEVEQQTVIPDIYRLTEQALWKMKPVSKGGDEDNAGKEDFTFERKLSGPLIVEAVTYDNRGTTEGRLLKFQTRRGWKNYVMPMGILAGDGTELAKTLMDMGFKIYSPYVSEVKKLIAGYINECEPAQTVATTESTGWHDDVFVLTGDELIGKHPNGRHKIIFSGEQAADIYRAKGTLKEYQEHVIRYCEGNPLLIYCHNMSYMGPVMHLTQMDNAGNNIDGTTSSGKSTAQWIASSVWGPPDPRTPGGSFTAKWNSTQGSIEQDAVKRNHTIMVIDELGESDAKTAGRTLYQLGSGVEKGRLNEKSQQRTLKTWSCMILSSAEKSIMQHMEEEGRRAYGGQMVRIMNIPADAGMGYGVFKDLHGMLEQHDGDANAAGAALSELIKANSKKYHGVAGREFINRLLNFGEKKAETVLNSIHQGFMKGLPQGASGMVRRGAHLYAGNAAAGELAALLGVTGFKPGVSIDAAIEIFISWLKDNGMGNPEERHALDQLSYFIESNWHNFIRWHEAEPGEHGARNIPHPVGYLSEDEEVVYIKPEVFKREASKGYKPEFLVKLLAKKEALLSSAGRKQFQIRPPNAKKPFWVYAIELCRMHEEKTPGTPGTTGTTGTTGTDIKKFGSCW